MAVVAGAAHSSAALPSAPLPQIQKTFLTIKPYSMYYVKKYADCWAIHNDDNGKSRPLTEAEVQAVQEEYPSLKDPKTCTIYADQIDSLENKP